MPRTFTGPEQWLYELAHEQATDPMQSRIAWSDNDASTALWAHDMLVQRAQQIETLQKTCDNAVHDLAEAQREIEARKAELADAWRHNAEVEQKLTDLSRETIYINATLADVERVEFVLDCFDDTGLNEMFTFSQLMHQALNRMRKHIATSGDDYSDIPF